MSKLALILVSALITFFATASHASSTKYANIIIRTNVHDTYEIKNSVLLEGVNRTMTGTIEVETADGSAEADLGNVDSEKLNSTMLIVKNKKSVTFIEKGTETYLADYTYLPDGTLGGLMIRQDEARAALQKDLAKMSEQMVDFLKDQEQVVMSVNVSISDYSCKRIENSMNMNCELAAQFLISIATDDLAKN